MKEPEYQAVVVVIREGQGYLEQVTDALTAIDAVQFVGASWPVNPTTEYDDDDPEFGTLEAFDQHPEK